MGRIYFRLLLVAGLCIFLFPQSSLAQHGGFHGGGGFHSGGGFHGGSGFHGRGFGGSDGFSGFRGGRGFGGFGARGFGGFRGGHFYGRPFYGGFRSYPRFYSSFGFGFGFGWPYWGGYPYWAYPYSYGYGPWWGADPYAYYYPYGDGYDPYDSPFNDPDWDNRQRRYDRRPGDNDGCRDYRHDCPPPGDNEPKSEGTKPSNGAVGERRAIDNYVTINFAGSGSRGSYRGSENTGAALRPAVRNAIAALRAMPPAARERQINSGRYASFSPEERELLLKASAQVRETYN